MPCKCPHCGEDICSTSESIVPNAQRTITLEIPESEWPLWRLTLSQMNTKFGMRGQGSLANMLTPWLKRFHDDFEMMRYFDDARLAMAYKIVENGWPCTVMIAPTERKNAFGLDLSIVNLRFELEEGVSDLEVSSCAPHEIADEFKAYFEDYIDRMAPMDKEAS
ncbi:hypothetical protein [Pseudosulfitobacter pseudonitzschiae]|uniref:hypothetical protein n=1 Tax=Pseudosulfitobacter pseudonitzschiae TaxID=1402135 RepID=UPI003B800F88